MLDSIPWNQFFLYVGISMLIAFLLALLLMIVAWRQVRTISVPPGAGFGETLAHTPFLVVVIIDLLDFALDVLAAPVTWVLLDRWGLAALRNVSALEALLPFTQPIPTMTISWIWVRLFGYEQGGKEKSPL